MLGGLQGVNYLQRTSIRGPRVLGVEQVWAANHVKKTFKDKGLGAKSTP